MVAWLKGIWDSIVNLVRLKPKHLLGIAIVCFVVIALPKPCREYLGYESILGPYRGWVSLAGLASGTYAFVMIIADFKNWFVKKWTNRRFTKNAPKKLRELSRQEKMYLAEYIKKDASTLTFHLSDGVVNGLIKKYILYQGADISKMYDIFAFNIQPWVLKAFNRYPELKNHIKGYASDSNLEPYTLF